jgi:hypothetical protein
MPLFLRVSRLPYSAMALYPFILIRSRELRQDPVLMNHECIHHRQQLELLILPFYLWYVLHYLINLLRFRDHDRAYRHIIFEREAYAMDTDQGYLRGRSLWSFLKF